MLNWQQQFIRDAMDSFGATHSSSEGTRSQHGVMGTERKEAADKGREGGGDVCLRGLGCPLCGFSHLKEREGGRDLTTEWRDSFGME